MIPTYGGVLSAIEKALQELMEEYWGVGKFLQDLVEGQERIVAAMEWRWESEKGSGNRDEEKMSKDGPGESQEGGTPLSASC